MFPRPLLAVALWVCASLPSPAINLDNPPVNYETGCIQSATVSQTEYSTGITLMASEAIGLQPAANGAAGIDGTRPVTIRKDRFGYYVIGITVANSCESAPTVVLTDQNAQSWQQTGTSVSFSIIAHQVAMPLVIQIYSSGGQEAISGTLTTSCPCSCSCESCSVGDVSGGLNSDGEGASNGTFFGGFDLGTSFNGDTSTGLSFNLAANSALTLSGFNILSSGGFIRNDSGPITATSTIQTDNTITSFATSTGTNTVTSYLLGTSPVLYRTLAFVQTGTTLRATLTDHLNSASSWQEWRHPDSTPWKHVTGSGMRLEVLSRTTSTSTSRVDRLKIYERPASITSGEVAESDANRISDVSTTYTLSGTQWKKTQEIIDPDHDALTTDLAYYAPGTPTWGSTSYAGTGLINTVNHYNGQTETYLYSSSAHLLRTFFAGLTILREQTTIWSSPTVTTVTTVGGTTVSQQQTTYSSSTSTSQMLYTDSSGHLDTVTTHSAPGADFGGLPTLVTHPDGTITTSAYGRSGGIKTVTVEQGVGTSAVTEGTSSVTKYTANGKVASRKTTALGTGSGTVLDDMFVTSADSFGRPLTIAYFPAGTGGASPVWTESFSYNCCGLATEKDKYGVTTTHTYDILKRRLTSTRLNVIHATVYDRLTTSSHRMDSGAPDGTNMIGKTVSNLSGLITVSYAPDASSGTVGALTPTAHTTSYSSGITTTVTSVGCTVTATSPPAVTITGGDVQTTQAYPDGRTYQSSGVLQLQTRYAYSATSSGILAAVAYLDGTTAKQASATQTDWAGRTTATGRLASLTSTTLLAPVAYYYNSSGQLWKVADADGVATLYLYNTKGERTTNALDINGNDAVNYGTDQVTFSETLPATRGTTKVLRTVSKVWPTSSAVVVSQTDVLPNGTESWKDTLPLAANGHSTDVGYGTSHQWMHFTSDTNWEDTTMDADGTRTVRVYQGGLLHAVESHDSATSPTGGNIISSVTYTYGSGQLNRVTQVADSRTSAAGSTGTTYKSLTCDAVTTVTDPGGRVTAYTYDTRGRVVEVNAPDTTVLNSSGTQVTCPNVTSTSYNPDGTVIEVSGDQTYRTTRTYDYAGRTKTLTTYGTTTATTTWDYDADTGQLTDKKDADNKGASYTYTTAGRVKTRNWARGKHTRYDYIAGRLMAVRYFTAASYDTVTNAGNDPDTGDVTYLYNGMGRVTTAVSSYTSNFPGVQVDRNYSPDNLALTSDGVTLDPDTTSTTATGSIPLSFQRAVHRSKDTLYRDTGHSLRAGYSTSDTLNASATYAYQATTGRLGTVTGLGMAGADRTFTYTYASNSFGIIQTLAGPLQTTTFGYETTRDLITGVTTTNPAGTSTLTNYQYTNNALGQRGEQRSGGVFHGSPSTPAVTWDWLYDNLGQLVSADNATGTASDRFYAFDGIGNRTVKRDGTASNSGGTATSYTPYKTNKYSAIGSLTPVHDDDGNMTAGPLPVAPGANAALVWDGENQLIRSTPSGGSTTSYIYDPIGRRVAKTTGTSRRYFIYDGWNLLAEYTGTVHTSGTAPALTLEQTYLWGKDLSGTFQGAGGVGGLLAADLKTGGSGVAGLYCPYYEANGNIRGYLSPNQTNSSLPACSWTFDPFGNVTTSSNEISVAARLPFRFSSKYFDSENGMYYYGYRYYDPLTGRWPSRDPVGERGGMNLYGFVGNDGLNAFDYLGEDINWWIDGTKANCARLLCMAMVATPGTVDLIRKAQEEPRKATEIYNGCRSSGDSICGAASFATFYELLDQTGATTFAYGCMGETIVINADGTLGYRSLSDTEIRKWKAGGGVGIICAAVCLEGAGKGMLLSESKIPVSEPQPSVKPPEPPKAPASAEVTAGDASAAEQNPSPGDAAKTPAEIFRKGSATDANLTPRPIDTSGLSTTVKPPLGKSQVIDPARLKQLEAVQDGIDHASVRPVDMTRMQEWIDSRGSSTPHDFTEELRDAIIRTEKR